MQSLNQQRLRAGVPASAGREIEATGYGEVSP
jgi:hypothetical protein